LEPQKARCEPAELDKRLTGRRLAEAGAVVEAAVAPTGELDRPTAASIDTARKTHHYQTSCGRRQSEIFPTFL